VDIVAELKSYSLNVQVHDPLASAREALEEYGLRLTPESELKPASAVIVAVGHQYYKAKGWVGVQALLGKDKGVVGDLKGLLSREQIPSGISLWRL
jgi:UDP-N-acetyl-D-galactosamine dehydrogenase